jgi:putative heme-binding domain-containing protein
LAAIDPAGAVELLGRVLADSSEAIGLREQASNALAKLNQEASRAELVRVLPVAPARLQTSIAAGLAVSREGAEALLALIDSGKASARLLQERIVQFWLGRGELADLKEQIAKLTAGLEPADKAIQDLIQRRRAGFAAAKPQADLGAKVFEKNCAACHQIGGKGAKIGPQLDGIGIRGPERLLEDVLDPNRNVDQAFRVTTLALDGGQVVSGLLLREEGEILILADPQGKEVRVPKTSVEERKLSQLSPMPANLADQVSEEDFYHLLSYLLSQKKP